MSQSIQGPIQGPIAVTPGTAVGPNAYAVAEGAA